MEDDCGSQGASKGERRRYEMAREDWGAIRQISTPPKEQPIQVDSPMQVAKEQPEGAMDILTSINTPDKETSVGRGVLTPQQITLLPCTYNMEEDINFLGSTVLWWWEQADTIWGGQQLTWRGGAAFRL